MDEKPMVRLLVVESDVEANFFKGALEENGINALVKGLDGGSAFGAALDGPDEIEVYVYSEDVEESKAIIIELMDEDGDEIGRLSESNQDVGSDCIRLGTFTLDNGDDGQIMYMGTCDVEDEGAVIGGTDDFECAKGQWMSGYYDRFWTYFEIEYCTKGC